MHTTPAMTQDRLERVLRSRLRPRLHSWVAPVSLRAHAIGPDGQGEPVPPAAILADPDAVAWAPFAVGEAWGPAWGTCWFEVTGRVPASHRDDPDLEIVLDLGWLDHSIGFQSEGLVFTPEGEIVKALNPRNAWIPLVAADGAACFAADGSFRFFVEAAANPLVLEVPPFEPVVAGEKRSAGTAPIYTVKRAEITHRDTELAALVADLEIASELAAVVPEADPRHHTLLAALDRALDVLDVQDLAGTIPAARAALAPELAKPAHASAHQVWATGHAHIDSAWLWPLRETVRKVARTISNQLALMDREPDHVYSMSSAQQYAWIEEHYPRLFERVKARVAEGRFVPVGGMWVESDTNMPSGEAMVRQFTHGKRYMIERFGIEPREVWLPDSFGYSAALPQLARAAGFDYFLTQKISWNDTNTFPHHSFAWEGIDSSRIFTHFPPADTYNGELTGAELAHATANFRDKGRSSHSLLPFGYGDGGGGPTREHLARARRWADLEGAAQVRLARPADFFAAAAAEYDPAPVWKGELYLELHRGTYTSQHATKQGNRHCEALLLEAERAWTAAHLRTGTPYPYDELEALWRTVLLHQFHDILPGSSIAWVHREAAETYARVEAELGALVDRACEILGREDNRADIRVTLPGMAGAVLAASREHDDTSDGGARLEPGQAGRRVLAQGTASATSLAPAASTSAAGVTPHGVTSSTVAPRVERRETSLAIEGPGVACEIDAAGRITSLRFDDGPELIAPGCGGATLELLRDEPVRWDAWDIDAASGRTAVELEAHRVEPIAVPGRAGARVEYLFGSSRVCCEFTVGDRGGLLHVNVSAEWHEIERLVRLVWPFDLACDSAQFETQFGYVTRDITTNTSWQVAQHEKCAQRWVRLAQGPVGVVIANESTYGHALARHERAGGTGSITSVGLTVLRAPRYPDPTTDAGHHEFGYAIGPAPSVLDAVAVGRALNLRRALVDTADLPCLEPGSTALVEVVKLADDRSGDVIVRLYEASGAPTEVALRVPPGLGAPVAVDLLERADADSTRAWPRPSFVSHGDVWTARLRGFDVVTVRLERTARPQGTARPPKEGRMA